MKAEIKQQALGVRETTGFLTKRARLLAWMIGVSTASAACGITESRGSRDASAPGLGTADENSGTELGTGGDRTSQPTRAAASFADLTSTLVEKGGLLPLAYFEFSFSGVPRPCMGAYVGQGRLVTAGHCLRGFPEDGTCPVDLRVRWLVHDSGAYALSGDKTACARVLKKRDEDGDKGLDLAILQLVGMGTWPEQVLTFVAPVTSQNSRVQSIGPSGSGARVSFRAFMGAPFENAGNYFHTNGSHAPGFSGTPVFIETRDALGPIVPSQGAVGLHVGTSDSASRVLRGDLVRDFLR